MDKLSLIQETEKLIPKDKLYTSISVHGKQKAFELFLETDFINFIKDDNTMSPKELANYVINKFGSMLKPSSAVKSIYEFIESKQEYTNTVRISEDTYFDFKKFLLNNIENINENQEVIIIINIPITGETRIQKYSFEHLYEQHLNGTYKEQTLEDKLETINFYINLYSNEEVLQLEYKDGKTFKEYLHDVVPQNLNNDSEFLFVDESNVEFSVRIDDFIRRESVRLQEQIENNKINEYNRINENPMSVKEIDASIELGGELPLFGDVDENDYIYNELQLIKTSIEKAKTIDILMKLVAEYKKMCKSLDDKSVLIYKTTIDSINDLIDMKAKNITIRTNNKPDLINYIIEELINLESKLKNDFDFYNTTSIDNKFMILKKAIVENSIQNQIINEKVRELDSVIESKRNLYKLINENKTLEHTRAINELDLLLMDIRKKGTELLFVDNEIKKASIEVKLEDLINNYNIKKDAHYKEHHLSMEEIIEYNNRLDNVLNLEGEKADERRI